MSPWQQKLNQAFKDHMGEQMKGFQEMENEFERREAYDIKPATLSEIARLFIETQGDIPLNCHAFTWTEKATNISRTMLLPAGVDPSQLSADDLDGLWSKFATKN